MLLEHLAIVEGACHVVEGACHVVEGVEGQTATSYWSHSIVAPHTSHTPYR